MKRTPLKRRRTTSLARLKRECDTLWAKLVKARYNNRCARCPATENLHAHHIIKRSRSAYLRHNLSNGLCLCRDCHAWWHGASEVEAVVWCAGIVGSETLDDLVGYVRWARTVRWKPTAEHYRDTKAVLEGA